MIHSAKQTWVNESLGITPNLIIFQLYDKEGNDLQKKSKSHYQSHYTRTGQTLLSMQNARREFFNSPFYSLWDDLDEKGLIHRSRI